MSSHLCRGAPCGRPGRGRGKPSPAGQFIFPAPIRHSRAGGNPRTFPPPKNVNRDTTNYNHTDTPESGFPIGYPGDVIPLPDPAPDSAAGGGANHTRVPSPCGTVHRGLIVKAGTSCAGARSQPTARPQPRHRICSLSPWRGVRLITLCEVRNRAGPSHHDLVNGSLLMKSTKYEGRNCAYRCPLDL